MSKIYIIGLEGTKAVKVGYSKYGSEIQTEMTRLEDQGGPFKIKLIQIYELVEGGYIPDIQHLYQFFTGALTCAYEKVQNGWILDDENSSYLKNIHECLVAVANTMDGGELRREV